jgi:hypothetical protein
MKKITLSILAIAMTLAVVTTSASALFSSTATVSGVTFSTGNANLQVWNGSTWVADYNPGNFLFQNMFPSYAGSQTFYLKNNSTSAITLGINAKIRNGATEDPSGSWNVLKDVVEVRFYDIEMATPASGWASLNYWNTTGANFVTAGISKGAQRQYRVDVRVVGSAGNEISDKSLTNMKFDFTGTQQ